MFEVTGGSEGLFDFFDPDNLALGNDSSERKFMKLIQLLTL